MEGLRGDNETSSGKCARARWLKLFTRKGRKQRPGIARHSISEWRLDAREHWVCRKYLSLALNLVAFQRRSFVAILHRVLITSSRDSLYAPLLRRIGLFFLLLHRLSPLIQFQEYTWKRKKDFLTWQCRMTGIFLARYTNFLPHYRFLINDSDSISYFNRFQFHE